MCRLLEVQGRPDEATDRFERLIEAYPGYLDCYMRLAVIARHRGQESRATELLDGCIAKARVSLARSLEMWLV